MSVCVRVCGWVCNSRKEWICRLWLHPLFGLSFVIRWQAVRHVLLRESYPPIRSGNRLGILCFSTQNKKCHIFWEEETFTSSKKILMLIMATLVLPKSRCIDFASNGNGVFRSDWRHAHSGVSVSWSIVRIFPSTSYSLSFFFVEIPEHIIF